MSLDNGATERTYYFDFNNPGDNNGKDFTDLQSCDHADDSGSQSVDSISVEFDDANGRRRRRKARPPSLPKEDIADSDEDSNSARNKKKSMNIVNLPTSSNDIIDLIKEDLYQFVFMPIAKQFKNYIRCRLIRNKYDMYHMFRLEIERENGEAPLSLLSAEKQSTLGGRTEYLISVTSKYSNESYSAELQSTNATGTNYSLYNLNGDERQQLAVILYESNFLGLRGPRKMEVLLPKFNNQRDALFDEDDIAEYDFNETNDYFIHLHNKPPEWNPQSGAYGLKFDGKNRVTKPSIKNFVLVIENEENQQRVVMQFGRMAENEFSCDFRYPLSLMQAFAIALSAFDSRLFRE